MLSANVEIGNCTHKLKPTTLTYWLSLVAIATLLFSKAALSETALNQLRYITEHSPPYNFVENGELKGPAVDLLLAATKIAGSPVTRCAILVQPWARAYSNTLEGPNTVLFNTIRTKERETLFKWAGPTGSEKYLLIAKKSRRIIIHSSTDLSNYRIGAVRDDAGEFYLNELNVPTEKLTLAVNVNSLGKMLNAGRIDMWAFGEDGWQQSLKESNIRPDDYEAVFVLKKNDYYFAFSLDVDDTLVEQMQQGIDQAIQERVKISP